MSPSNGLTRCALRPYDSWRLLASSLHDWSQKILETNPSRPSPRPKPAMPRPRPRPAVSRPRPRPRPTKNGLERSRDQDRGLEDYITDFKGFNLLYITPIFKCRNTWDWVFQCISDLCYTVPFWLLFFVPFQFFHWHLSCVLNLKIPSGSLPYRSLLQNSYHGDVISDLGLC